MRQLKTFIGAVMLMVAVSSQAQQAQVSMNCDPALDVQTISTSSLAALGLPGGNVSGIATFFTLRISGLTVGQEVNLTLNLTSSNLGTIINEAKTTFKPRSSYLNLIPASFASPEFSLTGADINNNTLSRIAQSGTLPDGRYVFNWTLKSNSGATLATTVMEININNPSLFVQLLSPGAELGQEAEEIYSPTPLFQWTGNSNQYVLTVWEDARGTGNFNDVVNTTPHVQVTVSTASFQYPSSGARVIQPGNTYFWQVTARNTSAGQSLEAKTPVFKFRLKGNDNLAELKRVLRDSYGIEIDWMKDATFVSFTGQVEGAQVNNSNDLEQLVRALKAALNQ